MPKEGQVVLFRFPHTDLVSGKLRPALLIRKIPNTHEDWLVCMISSKTSQTVDDFDELIEPGDNDFDSSGLKDASLIRITRLAVIHETILVGRIGGISYERLTRIRSNLADWLLKR